MNFIIKRMYLSVERKIRLCECVIFLNVSFALLSSTSVIGSTFVSGNVTVDSVWTKTASPYIVTDNLQILEGVKLTIEPGVTVKFYTDRSILVNGELKAIGKPDSRIIFTIEESQELARWSTIKFFDQSVDAVFQDNDYVSGSAIVNSTIEYGHVNCEKASPFIYNSTFQYAPDGYSYDGALNIENSNDIIVRSNIFQNNPDAGIFLKFSNSALISNNIITNNQIGVGVYLYYLASSEILISNNSINNNVLGVKFDRVSNANTIHLNQNNIFANSSYSIMISRAPSGTIEDIDASNNWWGGEQLEFIDNVIFDHFDYISLNKIIYTPYLSAYKDINVTNSNLPPQVNAGDDQIVFDTIIFDGSQSYDPDPNETLSYNWKVTRRGDMDYNIVLSGMTPTLSNLHPGFYDVTLTVKDNLDSSNIDNMFFASIGKAYTPKQYEQMVSEKDQIISNMYSESQLNRAVRDAIITFDIHGDGKIGIEEAINALQISSGYH